MSADNNGGIDMDEEKCKKHKRIILRKKKVADALTRHDSLDKIFEAINRIEEHIGLEPTKFKEA